MTACSSHPGTQAGAALAQLLLLCDRLTRLADSAADVEGGSLSPAATQLLIEMALQRETQSLAALTELQQVGAISEHEPEQALPQKGYCCLLKSTMRAMRDWMNSD